MRLLFSVFTQVLLLFSGCCWTFSAAAQFKISGLVLDKSDLGALTGVNVVWPGGGTTTDLKGYFEIELPDTGLVKLQFSYIGYEKQNRIFDPALGDQKVQIELKRIENALQEVLITASRFAQSRNTVTQSTEIVKAEQTLAFNSLNADDALNRIPGLNVTRGQLNIRGSSGFTYNVGSRVLVLMDGLPLITAESGEVKWNVLPLELVEQIEVIKGGGSALYGASALGGVVHFRTRKPGDVPETRVSFFQQRYDAPNPEHIDPWRGRRRPIAHGVQISHLRKIKDLDLSMAVNAMNDDGFREGEPSRRLRLSLGSRYRFAPGWYGGVNLSYLLDSTRLYTFWASDRNAYVPFEGSVNPQLNHRLAIDPYLEYIPDEKSRHSLRNRYFRSYTNYNNEDFGLGESYYTEYQYQRRLKLPWTKSSVVTAGLVNQRNLIRSDRLYGTQNTDNRSAYLQYDQHFWRINLALGGRFEQFITNGTSRETAPVFRAGINVEVSRTTFLRASFGQGFRYPSVAELYSNTFIGSVRLLSDPNLRPERSNSYEIGLMQGFQLGGFDALLDIAWFRTDYTDMIEYSFGVMLPERFSPQDSVDIANGNLGALAQRYARFAPGNVVQARISGIEGSLRGKMKAHKFSVEWLLGYTYMNPINLNPPKSLYNLPVDLMKFLKYRYQHLVRTDLTLGWSGWFLGVNVRYNSVILNIDEDFYTFMPGLTDYRLRHIEGDLICDARIVKNLDEHVGVSFIVRNLFNESYMVVPGNIGEQRTFVAQFNFRF